MSDEAAKVRDYEAIRRQALDWVRQAGAVARERFGRSAASRKADRTVVTDADHAVQDLLLGVIARDFPGDAVISEERQAAPGRHPPVAAAGRCWVVDPIDGTRNYARGLPIYGVSVALLEGGTPVVGIIFAPMLSYLYSAAAGGGAWLNERPIQAVDELLSPNSLMAVPSAFESPLPAAVHQWMDRMVLRNVGSTALHLALLAGGSLDAVFCDKSKLWDLAAGALIAEQAGAKVCSLEGRPYFPLDLAAYADRSMPFLAAGPRTLEQLFREYRQTRKD